MSSSDGGSGFRQFLNTTDTKDGRVPLVNTSNPVNWVRLGYSMLAGVATAAFVGIQNLVFAFQRLYTVPISGATDFVTSLITTPLNEIESGVSVAWLATNELLATYLSESLAGFIAGPVAIAGVLVTLWVMAQLWAWIRNGGVL